MPESLPEPFTPADCDLRGMEWMPLYGDRLFASDTWLAASPEGRCAAMLLWWAAWKQKPAGSLVDNDRSLAQIAGFGLSVKRWLKIKSEALHGWVKCSDGKIYHRIVSDFAIEAWNRRKKERTRKATIRSMKTTPDPKMSRGQAADRPRTDPGTSALTGQDRTGKKKEGSLRSPARARENSDLAISAMSIWNQVCVPPCTEARELSKTRRASLTARLREMHGDIAEWRALCERVRASAFLTGGGERGWVAGFDWILKPENIAKVLDGRFDNRKPTTGRTSNAASDLASELGLDLLTPIEEQFREEPNGHETPASRRAVGHQAGVADGRGESATLEADDWALRGDARRRVADVGVH